MDQGGNFSGPQSESAHLKSLSSFIERSSIGIAVADLDGYIRYANNSYARLRHYSKKDLTKLHVLDFATNQSRPIIEGLLAKLRRDELESSSRDLEMFRGDGTLGWYHVELEVQKDPETQKSEAVAILLHDITDRKTHERELQIKERRLEAIHRSNAIGMHYFKTDGRAYEPNEAILTMTGYTQDEVAKGALDWPKTTPEDWIDQDSSMYGQVRRTGQPMTLVKEMLRKDGERIPVCVTVAMLDPQDPYDGIVFIYDLSELFSAREEAQENRYIAELALESASIGIWDYDPKVADISWDQRCRTMFGFKAGEIDNLEAIQERIAPEDMRKICDLMHSALNNPNGHAEVLEFRVRTRDGERILRATGRSCQLKPNEDARLVGTVVDVTEARRAEKRIFESEEKFRTLAEAIPHMVFTFNPEGKITFMNRKWFEYTGLKDQPDKFPLVQRTVHPEDMPKLNELWQNAVKDAQPFELEHRMRSAKGDYRWFIVRALPLFDGRGNVQQWFGSCTDIDEQKRFNDELVEAKEAAERADKMKSSFLANMSHEIRTPLGAILGFTELLREDKLQDGESEEFLGIIARNGKTLSRIVDDILDLSKVEAGKLSIEKLPFSPSNLLSDTVKLFSQRASMKGLELSCHIDESVPQQIVSDPTRLKQIISNLISNAIKFTDQGSVNVYAERHEDALIVAVRDTGIGITSDQIAKLFQPFAQGDDSMSRRYGGTGLGLHLSRRLAEMMGGSLLIEDSKGNRGSTFILRVPIDQTTQVKAVDDVEHIATNLASRLLKNKRIMVVDDSKDNRLLMERMLTKKGAQVILAEDGETALHLAETEYFDVILMDIQMPGMDGFEATRRLRARGSKVPVIALTAHVIAEVRDECRDAGCSGFLTKPVQIMELAKVVAELSKNAPQEAYIEPQHHS